MANKPKISVEYSHIYTDEQIGIEHQKGIELLHELEEKEKDNHEVLKYVLIDDYSPVNSTLDLLSFQNFLREHNAVPTHTVMESELVDPATYMLSLVKNKRLQSSYERYVRKRGGHIPCSLFIAGWYAVRLGIIADDSFQYEPVEFTYTILPKRYEDIERRGIELIENSDYANLTTKIKHIFFDEQQYTRTPKF